MVKKNGRRRLTIDQAEALSLNSADLQYIEKIPSNMPIYLSPKVKFLYDRKFKRVILGGSELFNIPRFISLNVAQALVLSVIQKEPRKFKERIMAVDLANRIKLRHRNKETIEKIMRILTKMRILDKEKLIIQGQIVEVFKLREEINK